MKAKKFKRHRKRVRQFVAPWRHVLGLNWWENIEFHFYDNEKEFRKAADCTVVMRVWCDWRYTRATVAVNVPAVARLNDHQLERVVVHEFVHMLVNPMHDPARLDNEEYTVTALTKAFFWTRNLAIEQFGEKPE